MKRDAYTIRFSLCLLLFVNCSLWLFDGIIGWKRITFLVVLCGMMILCTKSFCLSKPSMIWLLFLAAVTMSLLINHAITNATLYWLFMYSLIVFYAILIKYEVSIFKTGIVFLTAIGIFNAIAVMVHFFMKEDFNTLYFPLLQNEGSYATATSYYDRGYFFGLNYKPHETAGIIIFAMAAFLIWGMVQTKYQKKLIYLAALCMVIPLLLTGKKGVTACMMAAFMLILFVWYASQKQWLKIGLAIGGAILLLVIAIAFILTHLDNPLYYRFASFFTRLLSGESVDAGRGGLRDAALQLWSEHKFFGVGWYQYNGYTVRRFGFSRTHSVNLDYLQFLCETGIVGFVLMITPIIVMLRRTIMVWKNTLTSSADKNTQWIILFAVFVQIYTVLYAFIEVPFYNIMYFTIYIFSCMIINNSQSYWTSRSRLC